MQKQHRSTDKSKPGASRDTLLAAAALQDQLARQLRVPGGPSKLPSYEPGARLTLAQHLGLLPRPPPLLTEEEWDEVHVRSRTRQDSAGECPICREDFKAAPQVLLSCSHTFHKACLASFERYSRSKVCPLCRCDKYQKRVIADGAEAYRVKCATRIQAWVRGHQARKRFRELQRHNPPKDPRVKAKWAAARLQEEQGKLLAAMDEETGDLDAFFAELDASVAQSRQACDAVLKPLAARLHQQLDEQARAAAAAASATRQLLAARGAIGDVDDDDDGDDAAGSSRARRPAAGPPLVESSVVAPALRLPSGQQPGSSIGSSVGSVDWDGVLAKAKARGDCDCPICLAPLGRRGQQGVAWLSCTHCFHIDCIIAFEAFELGSGGKPTCPVCRRDYRRRCFT